jgi:hypothetical protein
MRKYNFHIGMTVRQESPGVPISVFGPLRASIEFDGAHCQRQYRGQGSICDKQQRQELL